jgi:transcriptional regulator with PAS, ATPase and Fis domain
MIEKHSGNKTKMAKELGLSRYGLMKKMQRYGLEA